MLSVFVIKKTVSGLRIINESVDVKGKRVLVRIDGDVAIENGVIESGGEVRLFSCTETVKQLIDRDARVILMTHLGRPCGKIEPSLSVKLIAQKLAENFGRAIKIMDQITGPEVSLAVEAMQDGELMILENLRFDKREETNDSGFAKELADLADLYVDESFANSHRAHASMLAVTKFLPAYAGVHFAKEVVVLEKVMSDPKRPVVAAVSGAKIETKAALLKNLLPQIDHLITGGGVANMFIQAQGSRIGNSISEPNMLSFVRELLTIYGEKIHVPRDVRVLRKNSETGEEKVLVLKSGTVTKDDSIYDIGPETSEDYAKIINQAGTCVWNGPMGKAELEDFREGTKELAKAMHMAHVYAVVGGGDTVIALYQMNLIEGFNHISTGGGAMIALLEGEKLPAIEVLRS